MALQVAQVPSSFKNWFKLIKLLFFAGSKMDNYIPSGKTVELVIQSINDFAGCELALPGNWSPQLFFQDLKKYPVSSKKQLTELIIAANTSRVSYRDFFCQSRPTIPFPHPHQHLFEIFESDGIMLYFENYFLRLLKIDSNTLMEKHDIIIQYIEVIGKLPIGCWDNIVAKLGACCFQFFAKDPELYIGLSEEMSDQQLLKKLSLTLYPTPYLGQISIHDSRRLLLEIYHNKFEKL